MADKPIAEHHIPAAPHCPKCKSEVEMQLSWVTRGMGMIYPLYAYRCMHCKYIIRLEGIPITSQLPSTGGHFYED